MAFRHNSTVDPNEPDWADVDKTALPRLAFADMGEEDKKSTWRYPHHWVKGGTEKDENGIWTNGTLYLHRGGLNAAWAAANGARSGQETPREVIAHLKAHRAALGIESSQPEENLLTLGGKIMQLGKSRAKAASSDRAPKIVMEAYTGEPVEQFWSRVPLVIDTQGVRQWRSEGIPIVLNHDPDEIVGHARIKSIDNGRIVCEGRLSGRQDLVDFVLSSYENGFPWAVSIGADIDGVREVSAKETVVANGREYQGPLTLVTQASLIHVALVGEPADPMTAAHIFADKKSVTIQATGSLKIETQKDASQDRSESKETSPMADPIELATLAVKAEEDLAARLKAIGLPPEKESEHRKKFLEACKSIRDKAIEEKWEPSKFEASLLKQTLAVVDEALKTERPEPPKVTTRKEPAMNAKVIEAAFVRALGLKPDKYYQPDVCEQADKVRASIQQLLIEAAVANGMERVYSIDSGNLREVLEYAFRRPQVQAWSTASISDILSNVANKLLAEAFTSVEQAWRSIAAVRPLKDFKATTVVRLTDSLEYQAVPYATHQIPEGSIGEETYQIQAGTYGKLLTLRRQDIINDDLGALNDIQRLLGRGAGLALNRVFWGTFNNNSTFFTEARKNLVTGAALGLNSLATVVKAFREMTGANNEPLGIQPRIMLVPPALEVTAKQIFASTEIRDPTNKTPTANVFRGMFEPVVSAYLSATIDATNGSDTTWYLVASPQDLPVMLVGFLNGRDQPTVESAEADFEYLGVRFRGYFDFGVALAEYRAAIKATAT